MSSFLAIRKADSFPFAEIHHWLAQLRGHALAHLSEFQVASILKVRHEGESYYVAGVNVENAELGLGACAEEGAIAVAMAAFGPFFTVEEIYVTGLHVSENKASHPCYPCGECRQRLAQYVTSAASVQLIMGEEVEIHSFVELFPLAFSYVNIQPSLPELVVVPPKQPLPLMRKTEELTDEKRREWLEALMGDMRISGISEAVLLELDNGYTVAGTKIENPAYTASCSSFAAALSVGAVLFGPLRIVRAFCLRKDRRQHPVPLAPSAVTGTTREILRRYAAEDMPVVVL